MFLYDKSHPQPALHEHFLDFAVLPMRQHPAYLLEWTTRRIGTQKHFVYLFPGGQRPSRNLTKLVCLSVCLSFVLPRDLLA